MSLRVSARARSGASDLESRGGDVLVPLSEWSRGGFDLVSDLSFGCRIFIVSLASLLGLLGWVSELAWLKASWALLTVELRCFFPLSVWSPAAFFLGRSTFSQELLGVAFVSKLVWSSTGSPSQGRVRREWLLVLSTAARLFGGNMCGVNRVLGLI
ncbi:hypothetical protein HID58_040861 [Brassica napus]|uniref:Uncharacterized protein n=1 Tax=Brassica napus TaxID=3708 RepID=A0ABQ8BAE7_BRANA|nr:hypothetical protein HID58_040861 [Brassica napus]